MRCIADKQQSQYMSDRIVKNAMCKYRTIKKYNCCKVQKIIIVSCTISSNLESACGRFVLNRYEEMRGKWLIFLG